MISFYPGPSRLYSQVPAFMQEACGKGVLSINHRSKEFVEISKKTIFLFKQKLHVPEEYTLFFTSSATECWEIIAQSLIKERSYHLYNGAFGEKWMEYTRKLHEKCNGKQFDSEEELDVSGFPVPEKAELIALTQNETSNGTAISNSVLKRYRATYPEKLIAVDATSSMGGVYLDFHQADIWYASVQKCFGLPAGMAVMLCSPKAMNRALEIKEQNHYNSLTTMIERMKDFQTTYTPNVLSIFLLMKVLEMVPSILETNEKIAQRGLDWYHFFSSFDKPTTLIKNPLLRSKTVIALKGDVNTISNIKVEAKEVGLLLGNGYGSWKNDTFRIANFPAIEAHEIDKLKDFLTRFRLKY
jgi:phosphoserine aminotransferase